MECRHGNFWIGLGIGSILGAVAYRLSRTAKAKQLESEIYNAIHRIGRDAEIAAAHAERKAMDLGLLDKGDITVITAGLPLGIPGTTNMIKVQVVGHKY